MMRSTNESLIEDWLGSVQVHHKGNEDNIVAEQVAYSLSALPLWGKKSVTVGKIKVLLIRMADEGGLPKVLAVESECPHAGAPLEEGALCRGMLVCPWHGGTFKIETGDLVEPPPLRPLGRYAARVSGDDILVDPTPLARPEPMALAGDKHFVCAGAGAATAAAVSYLREHGFAGKLTVIDPHAEEPVDRTVLTKMALSGEMELEKIGLFKPEEAEKLKWERVHGTVKALDADAQTVTLHTGEAVPYDALLLATGGRPKRPHLPGAGGEHVFTIRHRADLEKMEPVLKSGARAVVVGDSFIALEAASALRGRKLDVTVVAKSKLPFAKQFGDEVAEALVQLHRDNGVKLLTEEEAVGIKQEHVVLKSGEELEADLVLLAVGIEPVTDYAPALPHAEDHGFKVSNDLKLAPGIWAAGDIATVDGLRVEHWRVAEQHGRVAAAAMLASATGGASKPYEGVPYFWTYHFGKRLSYVGHATEWDRVEIVGELAAMTFIALYVKGDSVVAALGCGMETAFAALVHPMCSPLTVAEAKQEMEPVTA